MASPPVLEDPNQLTRRAKTRIGVAIVLLTIAIGGLTLLGRQKPESVSEETPSQKQESLSSGQTEPVPAQINSAQQEPPPAPAPASPEPASPPESTAPPPPPVVTKLPPLPVSSPAKPGTNHAVVTEATPADKEVAKSGEKAPAASPVTAPASPTTPQKTNTPAAQPLPSASKPAAPPKNFDVQVGVFTDMDNAKQLQAKLAEHGIPSHTETRLQVGPFNTKAEADAAKEKLKSLGIGSVVVPGK